MNASWLLWFSLSFDVDWLIHMHTDHLNITATKIISDQAILWLTYNEYLFNLYTHFIPGNMYVDTKTL